MYWWSPTQPTKHLNSAIRILSEQLQQEVHPPSAPPRAWSAAPPPRRPAARRQEWLSRATAWPTRPPESAPAPPPAPLPRPHPAAGASRGRIGAGSYSCWRVSRGSPAAAAWESCWRGWRAAPPPRGSPAARPPTGIHHTLLLLPLLSSSAVAGTSHACERDSPLARSRTQVRRGIGPNTFGANAHGGVCTHPQLHVMKLIQPGTQKNTHTDKTEGRKNDTADRGGGDSTKYHRCSKRERGLPVVEPPSTRLQSPQGDVHKAPSASRERALTRTSTEWKEKQKKKWGEEEQPLQHQHTNHLTGE